MKKFAMLFGLLALSISILACGSKESASAGRVIKSAPAGNNLTVALTTSDGVLRHGKTEFTLSFSDATGKPVDVGSVALTFHMPQMGTMQAMNDQAAFTTTETPGVYQGKVDLEMAGEWQAQIRYEGPAGIGQTSFPVTAQ